MRHARARVTTQLDKFNCNAHMEEPALTTPFLEVNIGQLQRNVERIRAAFLGADLYYALKCNPHSSVLHCLQEMGVGFEIASLSELRLVDEAGVEASRLACFHPIKSSAFLQSLHRTSVDRLAVDSLQELQQIARFCPGANVFVRLDTGTQFSRLLLNKKFGCSHNRAMQLLHCAQELGLNAFGITIHVGSQCEQLSDWQCAAEACYRLADDALGRGIPLQAFSLGGGLPVSYQEPVISLVEIAEVMLSAISAADRHGQIRFMLEPGRAIVSTAGKLHASVIAIAERDDATWVYLDAGIYHGLSEKLSLYGGFVFPIETQHPHRGKRTYRLAGPTCDSTDTLPGIYTLPELHVGDRVTFLCAGSYTTSLATGFNGFAPPSTRVCASGTSYSHGGVQ